jgi:hypothetical protein
MILLAFLQKNASLLRQKDSRRAEAKNARIV